MPARTNQNSAPRAVTDVDVAIGTRLKRERLRAGLSQTAFGERAGLSGQQIQKYESGQNKVALSRAIELAVLLGISLDAFTTDDPT